MKKIILLFIALAIYSQSKGQGYDTALGIRLGTEWGITVQQRVAKRITIEGIIQSAFRRKETTITLLGERHHALGFRNINIYTGAGLHKGWSNGSKQELNHRNPFGVTAIAGAEASIGRYNLSWDFKPALNIVGGERLLYSETAISVRYVIDKRKIFNKKRKKKGKKKKSGFSLKNIKI